MIVISVKHMFLAMLSQKKMHGYDMKLMYDKLLVINQNLNFGQIYSTIARMERDHLVVLCQDEAEAQEGGNEKKIYEITKDGLIELERWLSESDVWETYTDNLSYKLAVSDMVDKKILISSIRDFKISLMRKMQELVREQNKMQNSQSGAGMVIERNILRLEADIKWIDSCLEKLSD